MCFSPWFPVTLDPPPPGQPDHESFLASREGCHSRTREQKRQILGFQSLKSWASGFRQKRFGRILDQLEPIFSCPRKIKIPLAGRQEAILKQSKRVRCLWLPERDSCTLFLPPPPKAEPWLKRGFFRFWEQGDLCLISRLEAKRWQTSQRSPLPSIVPETLPGTPRAKGYGLPQRIFHGPRVAKELWA